MAKQCDESVPVEFSEENLVASTVVSLFEGKDFSWVLLCVIGLLGD